MSSQSKEEEGVLHNICFIHVNHELFLVALLVVLQNVKCQHSKYYIGFQAWEMRVVESRKYVEFFSQCPFETLHA